MRHMYVRIYALVLPTSAIKPVNTIPMRSTLVSLAALLLALGANAGPDAWFYDDSSCEPWDYDIGPRPVDMGDPTVCYNLEGKHQVWIPNGEGSSEEPDKYCVRMYTKEDCRSACYSESLPLDLHSQLFPFTPSSTLPYV